MDIIELNSNQMRLVREVVAGQQETISANGIDIDEIIWPSISGSVLDLADVRNALIQGMIAAIHLYGMGILANKPTRRGITIDECHKDVQSLLTSLQRALMTPQ
jgi:hypothetical protein